MRALVFSNKFPVGEGGELAVETNFDISTLLHDDKTLEQVEGVERITVGRYGFSMTVAYMFDLESVMLNVIKIFRDLVGSDVKVEIVRD